MFLRFHTRIPDAATGRPLDLAAAARRLLDSGNLGHDDEQWLRDCLDYFNRHLKIPDLRDDAKNGHAIAWFRFHSSMVPRAHGLMEFLERHGTAVEMIETGDPGIVHYEDSHQVVAKSRASGPAMTRQGTMPAGDLPPFLKKRSLTRTAGRRVQDMRPQADRDRPGNE